jgi:hypothetical protein
MSSSFLIHAGITAGAGLALLSVISNAVSGARRARRRRKHVTPGAAPYRTYPVRPPL